jgi:hypothetical protein
MIADSTRFQAGYGRHEPSWRTIDHLVASVAGKVTMGFLGSGVPEWQNIRCIKGKMSVDRSIKHRRTQA